MRLDLKASSNEALTVTSELRVGLIGDYTPTKTGFVFVGVLRFFGPVKICINSTRANPPLLGLVGCFIILI